MPNQYTTEPRPAIYVIGPSIAYIPLTKGLFALVDSWRAGDLSQSVWCVSWSKKGRAFYAVRHAKKTGKLILMHRVVLELADGDERQGDHKEPSRTLDNRMANLRIATNQEGSANKGAYCTNTTGYKGVHLRALTGRFRAQITVKGKKIHLGYFDTAEEAHEAYKAAALLYFGEFGRAA